MESLQSEFGNGQKKFKWAHFGLGCISGVILSGICFFVVILSIVGLYLFSPGERTSNPEEPEELDISAQVMVESDGCTVTRTELQGTTSVSHLQWVVIDEAGEQVLGRSAEGEYQYTYYRPGNYRVYLVAWYAGEYHQISNEVLIKCP